MTTAIDAPLDARQATGRPAAGPLAAVRVPLRTGFPLALAAVLLPVLAILGFGLFSAIRSIEEIGQLKTAHFADTVARQIHAALDPAAEAADYLAAQVAEGRIDPRRQDAFGIELAGALAGLPQIRTAAFIAGDGRGYRVNRAQGRVQPINWSGDQETMLRLDEQRRETRANWGEFFVAASTGATLLNVRAPLRLGGEYLGMLVLVVATESLSQSLARTKVDPQATPFVLTDEGLVLAHPKLGNRPAQLSDSKPLPGPHDLADKVLVAGRGPLKDAVAHAPSATVIRRKVTVDGVEHVLAASSMAGYAREPWIVGYHMPADRIALPRQRLILLAAIGALMTALSVALCAAAGAWVVTPIRRIARTARRIEAIGPHNLPRLGRSRIAELDEALSAFEGMLTRIVRVAPYLPTTLSRRFRASAQALDPQTVARRPQLRRVTVMFTDIVDFTSTAAGLTAEEVARLLNEHFAALVECVERNSGNVDKFIGDAMMAYWSDEDPDGAPALSAFACALDIRTAISRQNDDRRRRGQQPIRVRIGLHTGPAIVGDIGGSGSVNHTLIGDTVNIAQRVEALGKAFMQPNEQSLVLVTRATVDELGQGLEAFSLGERLLPGSPTPVEVFRVA